VIVPEPALIVVPASQRDHAANRRIRIGTTATFPLPLETSPAALNVAFAVTLQRDRAAEELHRRVHRQVAVAASGGVRVQRHASSRRPPSPPRPP
jgi:hypothetical protein